MLISVAFSLKVCLVSATMRGKRYTNNVSAIYHSFCGTFNGNNFDVSQWCFHLVVFEFFTFSFLSYSVGGQGVVSTFSIFFAAFLVLFAFRSFICNNIIYCCKHISLKRNFAVALMRLGVLKSNLLFLTHLACNFNKSHTTMWWGWSFCKYWHNSLKYAIRMLKQSWPYGMLHAEVTKEND